MNVGVKLGEILNRYGKAKPKEKDIDGNDS